jgi:hypothetical protein
MVLLEFLQNLEDAAEMEIWQFLTEFYAEKS